MNTAGRLKNYYEFDADIVASIDDAGQRQNDSSFAELADQYKISGGSHFVLPDGASKPVEVLELYPKSDYDRTSARIYHTAFAYPVNENTAMHALRLFAADPSEQLIVIGNPAMPFKSASKLSFRQSAEVAHTGMLRPAVDGLLKYLEQRGIEKTKHLGYSYGADKAITAAHYSTDFEQQTDAAVVVEPVSVVKRSLRDLTTAFMASGERQQEYIQQTESTPYLELWQEDNLLKTAAWMAGILRVSNLAIAKALCSDNFVPRVSAAMNAAPEMKVAVAWGEMSELARDQTMIAAANTLRAQFKSSRFSALRIHNTHHAAVDDIDLHAAIMLQGLRAASR